MQEIRIDFDGGRKRQEVSLNGRWRCYDAPFEDSIDRIPEEFTNSIPVPGLWDMAEKPFPYVMDAEVLKTGKYEKKALWYQKKIIFAGAVPPNVTLKLHKAFWGKDIYINRRFVASHQPNFTPAYVDITPYLKENGQENTLLIKVGDKGSQDFSLGHPNGFDAEKKYYIPGIYDDVTLILRGKLGIDFVQAAPDIDLPGAVLQAVLHNRSAQARVTSVRLSVRRKDTGELVADWISEPEVVAAGQSVTVRHTLQWADPILWCPENPFLYSVSAETEDDCLTASFGMRKFCYDQETRRPMLNNQPYYLYGTNFCIYRFFEDPLRGGLPWDRSWVERLIQKMKEIHLCCSRFTIGFAPDFWYDVCDEMGFLVFDEYPIWGAYECQPNLGNPHGVFAEEVRDWIRERANHPCVIVWDIQNETHKETHGDNVFVPNTADVIRLMRQEGIDLSGRPWDNGWMPPESEEDGIECHPYLFLNPDFRLSYLNITHPDPARIFGEYFNEEESKDPAKIPNNPRIINEYSWLWIDRNGQPTTLTESVYRNLLPQGTAADYRKLYASYVAQLTEFWRTGRCAAGILEFCGLTYSRENGQTCDNLLPDITNPQFDPLFEKRVGDSFAPVGIVIEDWSEYQLTGAAQHFDVAILNDQNRPWSGPVTLTLYLRDEPVFQETKQVQASPMEKVAYSFCVRIPDERDGVFHLVASYVDDDGKTVESVRDFVHGVPMPSPRAAQVISRHAVVTVSSTSTVAPGLDSSHLVDGNLGSRWSSAFRDDEWVQLDLGRKCELSGFCIIWEAAAAGKSFVVEVSDNEQDWTPIYEQTEGRRDFENGVLRAAARYVRFVFQERYSEYGYSIFEIMLFGSC